MKTPDTINGKTPEEIKADAATCLTRPPNSECTRFTLYRECAGDCRYVIKELYDLVLCYESRLEQMGNVIRLLEKENEAAVNDLFLSRKCFVCEHYDVSIEDEPCKSCQPVDYAKDKNNFKWRGVCEQNTKEEPECL